jgi:hypothetical protein
VRILQFGGQTCAGNEQMATRTQGNPTGSNHKSNHMVLRKWCIVCHHDESGQSEENVLVVTGPQNHMHTAMAAAASLKKYEKFCLHRFRY